MVIALSIAFPAARAGASGIEANVTARRAVT